MKTLYLGSWRSLQEAEIDLADPGVLAALRRKIGSGRFEAAELLIELKRNAARYVGVPRYATELAMQVVGPTGRVEWDLGGGFWKDLSRDIVARTGLLSAVETNAFHLANPASEIRRAVGRYQVEVENASRDLQARIRKTMRKYTGTKQTRTEIEEAMATLQLGGPIAKLTLQQVKRQFGNYARLYHPDAGGTSEGFIHYTHARDVLICHLDALRTRPKG